MSLTHSFLSCHILDVFRHEPCSVEMVIIMDVDLLFEINIYIIPAPGFYSIG